MSESQYPAGFYVKGDSTKVARSAAAAVALVFDGYRIRTSEDTDYRALQRQAKAAGISPKQSASALTEALNAQASVVSTSESTLGVPPVTGGDSPLDTVEVLTDDTSALDTTSTDYTDEN